MKPSPFKYSNSTLQPSGKVYSEDIGGVESLPIFTNGEQCISCWHMSWRERFSSLFFGKVWIAVLSGKTQPPIYAQVSNTYLEESK